MIQLGSVNLTVTDMRKMEAFYVDVLGLTVDAERTNRPSFVLLRTANCMLILQQHDTEAASRSSSDGRTPIELGFEVTDLATVRERLGERATVQDMGWGRAIETTDPEGTRLNLYQWS